MVDAFHRRLHLSGCKRCLAWLGPGTRRLRSRQLRLCLRDRSIPRLQRQCVRVRLLLSVLRILSSTVRQLLGILVPGGVFQPVQFRVSVSGRLRRCVGRRPAFVLQLSLRWLFDLALRRDRVLAISVEWLFRRRLLRAVRHHAVLNSVGPDGTGPAPDQFGGTVSRSPECVRSPRRRERDKRACADRLAARLAWLRVACRRSNMPIPPG